MTKRNVLNVKKRNVLNDNSIFRMTMHRGLVTYLQYTVQAGP